MEKVDTGCSATSLIGFCVACGYFSVSTSPAIGWLATTPPMAGAASMAKVALGGGMGGTPVGAASFGAPPERV